mgnify:CR=1 FL=1
MKEYQKKRILVFLNPESDPLASGYHVIQSKIAIGSGKIFGKGLYHGTQTQLDYLPAKHTDFIYAVVGEELGMIGCIVVASLLFALVARCIYNSSAAKDQFGSNICIGVAFMLLAHIFENIGMCIGVKQIRNKLADMMQQLVNMEVSAEVKEALNAWLANKEEGEASKEASEKVIEALNEAQVTSEEAKERLEKAIRQQMKEDGADKAFLKKQLNLMPSANISTFHTFALEIMHRFFYLTDLEPGFKIGDDVQISIMRSEVMDELFDIRFEEDYDNFKAFLRKYSSDRNENRIKENIDIFDFEISVEDMIKIDELDEGYDASVTSIPANTIYNK